ncbi:MAG TPA: hypothetical protein VIY56_10850 [Vicinamibacterales bacterium]
MFRPRAGWLALTIVAVGAWVGTVTAQTGQTRQVMREKLELSEILLGALVTSNWGVLGKNAQGLVAVINRPGWQVFEAPEYTRQTRAFLTATQALIDASDQRDQRVALSAYNGLVASCVECHRYVARLRVAARPPRLPGVLDPAPSGD